MLRRRTLRKRLLLQFTLALGTLGVPEAYAQATGVDPTAAQVAHSLRTKGNLLGARAVLTQARGRRNAQETDEMADTLVAIASTYSAPGAKGVSVRLAALNALLAAGRGNTGIDDGSGGVPYVGAPSRLKRLAETAQDAGTRSAAVYALVRLPDSVAHFSFLGHVAATARDEVAQTAATLLVNDLGPAGRAVARDLWVKGLVTQWSARNTLDGGAQKYGWRRR